MKIKRFEEYDTDKIVLDHDVVSESPRQESVYEMLNDLAEHIERLEKEKEEKTLAQLKQIRKNLEHINTHEIVAGTKSNPPDTTPGQ